MPDAAADTPRPQLLSYRDFWPHYLREHARPQTRAIHLFGTAIATSCIVALAVTGQIWFAFGALIGRLWPSLDRSYLCREE